MLITISFFYEDLHANIRRKKYISRYVPKTSKRDFTRKKKKKTKKAHKQIYAYKTFK